MAGGTAANPGAAAAGLGPGPYPAAHGAGPRLAEPADAEGWKQAGGEAYGRKDWPEALRCYTAAVEAAGPKDALRTTCLNNRAACHAQLGDHARVVDDATAVIDQQPANLKALLRRMVALDALGRAAEALEDASAVLTLEPKNPHALQVVANKRKSLTKRGNEGLAKEGLERMLCVFLFTEDRPLQCYACLRSLQRRAKGVRLHVHVFWQASDPDRIHSYQLLQVLPETARLERGTVHWLEASRGQLFPAFSRSVNRLAVEGMQHVLFLSDRAVFHTDVDLSAGLRVLDERREAFSLRLDVNPRIDHFPEEQLYASAPPLQAFAGDGRLALWTRSFDRARQAYEAVPRERGWDAILDWTATIVRAEHVQHFFSALLPPLDTFAQLDDKAADWLSRRQRMKRSELSPRSACYLAPLLVVFAADACGGPAAADAALRRHLARSAGQDGVGRLAAQTGWTAEELKGYLGRGSGASVADLEGLLEPERFRPHYLNSATVTAPPRTALPKALAPPAPLVSWLVPVRNADRFVARCLESIDGQTGLGPGCAEVIFVEDASEDATPAVLRRLCADRPDLRLVECATQLGVAGALAEGWSHCRGDFVVRLDADDEAESDRLLKQLRYMEQHPSISVLGGRTRAFWTEERKCTLEKVTERPDGQVSAIAWREDHGQQTSRRREQLLLRRQGATVAVVDGPAEYHNCQITHIGDTPLALNIDEWQGALRRVCGGLGEVLLERRDPLEPPAGCRALHPLLVRAGLLFEDCVAGTTAMLRRAHFPGAESPFRREEAEGHWTWLGLGPERHAANLADVLVRARRHAGCRAARDASGIQESGCAAVQEALRACGQAADLQDAAALLHLRGPRTPEQGHRLLQVLDEVAQTLVAEFVRPQDGQGEFWTDFVQGQESALEAALLTQRHTFRSLVAEVSRVVSGDKSPRQHRSRTPPR